MAEASKDARFWSRSARKYAESKIGDMAGYERTLARTREFLKPEDRVLEIGCGTGTTALALAPACASLLATDFSEEMIRIAQEKAAAANLPNLTFETTAPDGASWPDGSFDAVLAFNVLHLVKDRPGVLASVHRLLRPGGLFISKTPCLTEMSVAIRMAIPLMQAIGKAPHVATFTASALRGDIVAAGFDILAEERHGTKGKDVRPFFVAQKK